MPTKRYSWAVTRWRGLDGIEDLVQLPDTPTPPTAPSGAYYERGSYGTALGAYDYTPAANAVWVDTVAGNDANSGALNSPWRTVEKALAAGQGRQVIFRGVRGGDETNARWIKFGRVRSQLTSNATVGVQVLGNGTRLMGAPGEAVGFSGYDTITGPWTRDAATGFWWRSYTPFDWSPQDIKSYWGLPEYATAISTDDWRPIDGKDPSGNASADIYWQQVDPNSYFGSAAARPERMKYDGVKFIQIDKLAKLQPGRFLLDAKTNRHWIADDPTGHRIEFTVQQKLFNFLGYDQAFVNLGVLGYADSMPQGGVLSTHRARFTMDHAWVSDVMAGLTLQGVNSGISSYDSQIVNSTFRYSKSIHLRGTKSDRVKVENNFFLNGNDGLFNPAPACGGVKFTYLRDTDINRNKFVNAELDEAPGITGHGKMVWFDAAVLRPTIRNNEFWFTGQRSVVNELTCDAVVFNNLDMFPGAESQAFVDCGGQVMSQNNTVVGAGRLRGRPETVIKIGFWRGGIVTTVRDGRQRDVAGLAPPSYVFDGRENATQWQGGNGNEAVAPLEPYPFQGNTPKSLSVRNNVYCRWDETAAYVDEEQRSSASGVSWTGTGRDQDYNYYQPPTSYSPPDADFRGPNAGLAYLDNNTSTAVTAGTQAQLQALGLDANSRFYPATDPDIVDQRGALKNPALHAQAAVIPANLLALLPPGVTPAGPGNRHAGRIAATVASVPAHVQVIQSGTNDVPARIQVYGDSRPFGAAAYGVTNPKHLNCWPGRLRTALAATYGDAGTGITLANHNIRTGTGAGVYDPRWTWGAGVTDTAEGFYRAGAFTIPDGQRVTFTATCVQFVVYLLAKTAGVATVSVDGDTPRTIRSSSAVTATTISPQSGNAATYLVSGVGSYTLGQHTLTLTASGGDVELFAVEGRTKTGRVAVDNISISGKSLGGLVSTGAGDRAGLPLMDVTLRQGPAVAICEHLANDWQGGVTLAVYKANLLAWAARVRAAGDVPVLYTPPQPSTTLPHTLAYGDYVATQAQVATEQNIAHLNHWKLFCSDSETNEQAMYDAGNALGMFADPIHENNKGSQAVVDGYGDKTGVRAFLIGA